MSLSRFPPRKRRFRLHMDDVDSVRARFSRRWSQKWPWTFSQRWKNRLPLLLSSLLLLLLFVGTGTLAYLRFAPLLADRGVAREYWLAVVPVRWNVAPTGVDGMTGAKLSPQSTTFEALIYQAYTPNWGRPLPDPNGGMPGPTLYAQVGDQLIVHFKNMDTYYQRSHSVHPHGVHYTPTYDGAYVTTEEEPGSLVPVGGQFTYRWTVGTDSLGTWVYHDHSVDAETSTELGMYGNIVITRRGDPQPDKRFFVFFGELMPQVTLLPQMYYTINGRAFLGNLPPYRAKVGDQVQWVVSSLGNSVHVFHIHGHRWQVGNHDEDTLLVGPGQSFAVSFVENNPGTWLVHCHVDMHMMMGMVTSYEVDS